MERDNACLRVEVLLCGKISFFGKKGPCPSGLLWVRDFGGEISMVGLLNDFLKILPGSNKVNSINNRMSLVDNFFCNSSSI